MLVKIENNSETELPRNTQKLIDGIFKVLPSAHVRGIDRIRFVKRINDSQIRVRPNTQLPALYHPKQAAQSAWLEIATDTLKGPQEPFHKRAMLLLSFKSNLASLIISLVGQHYHFTLRHSVKRGQMESAIRGYTEKYLRIWSRNEHQWRSRLVKPLEPYLEKWAKNLRRNISKERAKSQRTS
jgi:predicted metal-dependent hydrolase